MPFLTKDEKVRIADAVRAAEGQTSGEFVPVIANACDHYLFIPLLWAAVLALILPGALLMAGVAISYIHIYQIQLVLFVVLGLIFLIPPVRMRCIPRSIRHDRAAHVARAQFYEQGVHLTRDHSGVLFFVSVAERYVEIIADRGIHEKVGERRWREIVEGFTQSVRAGKVADGFVAAIESCGAAMAQNYPRADNDSNELRNRLIEI